MQADTLSTDLSGESVAAGGKYLTFRLGEEVYGLEILKVQEIIKMLDITQLPRSPAYIRGVINLRGKVIPVIDIRLKFGMPHRDATERTCIVVVQIEQAGMVVTMGVIVDEVSEVLDIPKETIEPPPSFGTSVSTDFILGIAKSENGVKILLDIARVLTTDELGTVNSVAESAGVKE